MEKQVLLVRQLHVIGSNTDSDAIQITRKHWPFRARQLCVFVYFVIGLLASVIVVSCGVYGNKMALAWKGGASQKQAWEMDFDDVLPNRTGLTCAEAGENCSQSNCCMDQNLNCCRRKHESFATCRNTCDLTTMDSTYLRAHDLDGPNSSCSKDGDDCRETKCCQSANMQCFEKNEFWASCKTGCSDSVLDPTDWKTWTCKKLGLRTPRQCSAMGDDCSHSKCCVDEDLQCFQKNDSFASCKKQCNVHIVDHTDPDPSPWSCRRLFPFMQSAAPAPSSYSWNCAGVGQDCRKSKCCKKEHMSCYAKDQWWASCHYACDSHFVDPMDNKTWTCKNLGSEIRCSWPGEDCGLTKCCNSPSQKCYEMNKHFAGCRTSCVPGINAEGWSCDKVGGSIADRAKLSAAPHHKRAKTSLFCVTVITLDTHELSLARYQYKKNIGVFACDNNLAFKGNPVKKIASKNLRNFYIIDVFRKIWDDILTDGRYREYDWTVKLDIDAVFFPDRLRQNLARLSPFANTSIYIKNSPYNAKAVWEHGFAGPIEIFSEQALELYLLKKDICFKNIGHLTGEGFLGGEHVYMRACMDVIGVGFMSDPRILIKGPDVNLCANASTVAFHIHEDIETWMSCHELALKAEVA